MREFCECCGAELNHEHVKWLELNSVTGAWSDPDRVTVSAKESQGLFPFGKACAKRRLRESAAR